MSSDYREIPKLADRIATADVIVIGSAGRLVRVEPDPTEGVRRVFGLFELLVDEVLVGDLPETEPRLRVLGEGQDDRAQWLVPVEDARLVFLLAREAGAGIAENTFAPVNASGFPLEDDGRVRIPTDAVDELTERLAGYDRSYLRIDGLRRLVEFITNERIEAARSQETLLGEEALTRPYPEIEERTDLAKPSLGARPARIVEAQAAAIDQPGEPSGER